MTPALADALIAALSEAAVDESTRAVLLKANGDHFCSGWDLGSSAERPPRPAAGHLQRGFPFGPHRLVKLMIDVQLPVIVAVQGYAAGFGNSLALSGDIVVAAESARFWSPFVPRGFTPDSGTTYLLPRLIGLARAKEMVLRGKEVDGRTAEQWGLVSRCVADDELGQAAREIAEEMASAATIAVGLAKTVLHRNLEVDLDAALQQEGIYEELAVRSDDFKEGMRSFGERRPPNFTG